MWRPSTPTAGAPRAHCSLSVSPKVEKSFRFFESRGGDESRLRGSTWETEWRGRGHFVLCSFPY